MAKIVSFDNNSVIDMGVMQEMANAINKHDDLLVSFTNDSSSAVSEVLQGDLIERYFDPSVQAIMYGRASITVTGGVGNREVPYTTPFSSAPIVMASPSRNAVNGNPYDVMVSDVQADTFTIEVRRYDFEKGQGNGTLFVDWIAIGNKVG